MPSTIATMMRSVPIMSVPIASNSELPVIAVRPTPKSAKNRPVRAAMSSSRTTGSSGAFACRTNETHDWPFVRTWLLSLTAVRSDSDSSTIAITSTRSAPQKFSSSCGCVICLDALRRSRKRPPHREENDRDDERVDVSFAAVAERMSGLSALRWPCLPSAEQQQQLVAAVGDRVDRLGEHRCGSGQRPRDELCERDAHVRQKRRDDGPAAARCTHGIEFMGVSRRT